MLGRRGAAGHRQRVGPRRGPPAGGPQPREGAGPSVAGPPRPPGQPPKGFTPNSTPCAQKAVTAQAPTPTATATSVGAPRPAG
jgi:hypothetical protein